MPKNKFLKGVCAALQALFVFSFAYGQVDKAETGIKAIMKEREVVGLSVAVVKKGKIIY